MQKYPSGQSMSQWANCPNTPNLYITGGKGKEVKAVQLQIFKFISYLPQKIISEKSFQKHNFGITIFTVKNSF